jgi:class 3 adenylate cyclase
MFPGGKPRDAAYVRARVRGRSWAGIVIANGRPERSGPGGSHPRNSDAASQRDDFMQSTDSSVAQVQPRLRRLVILAADLAGFTRLVGRTDAEALARMLDAWYHASSTCIVAHGGRVVKFMGDGVLAVFPEDAAVAAVDCGLALLRHPEIPGALRMGANLHMAQVAEGELGPQQRYDVVGIGVNHTFLLGRGPGLRLSEPVYRQLPPERRTPWQKHRPPAIYTHES